MNRLKTRPSRDGPWKGMSVEQCLFGTKFKDRVKHFSPISISFKALPFGLFGLREMIKCLTRSDGLNTMLSPSCGAISWIMVD
jgi:hypothetical protein